MENVIHKDRIEHYLATGGNITDLVERDEQMHLNRLIFANKMNWEKIFDLPEFVYHSFDMKMRRECYVSEVRFPSQSPPGPHIEFYNDRGKTGIRIDSENVPNGILNYRRYLTVVAYFAGIRGRHFEAEEVDDSILFSDEDWIIMSMAARFSLMPPKFIQKIYLLTQMNQANTDEGNDQSLKSKSFISSFVENLVFQTRLPSWVVTTRLHEHAFADKEFSEVIRKRTVDEMIEEYRSNEHYQAPVI